MENTKNKRVLYKRGVADPHAAFHFTSTRAACCVGKRLRAVSQREIQVHLYEHAVRAMRAEHVRAGAGHEGL
jgi:hypothetical protein